MTGLGNPYERNSDYVIASAKHDAWDEGFLQGRRYQYKEDVEWLENYILSYFAWPDPLVAKAHPTLCPTLGEIAQRRPAVKLADAIVQAFKNVEFK